MIKSIKWKWYLFIIIPLIISCSLSQSVLIGIYSSSNNKNIYDTLIIKADGSYEQRLRYIQEKSIVFVNKGILKYSDDRILLKHFIAHEDEPYSINKIDSHMIMDVSFPVIKSWKNCYIGYNEEFDNYQYQKI